MSNDDNEDQHQPVLRTSGGDQEQLLTRADNGTRLDTSRANRGLAQSASRVYIGHEQSAPTADSSELALLRVHTLMLTDDPGPLSSNQKPLFKQEQQHTGAATKR